MSGLAVCVSVSLISSNGQIKMVARFESNTEVNLNLAAARGTWPVNHARPVLLLLSCMDAPFQLVKILSNATTRPWNVDDAHVIQTVCILIVYRLASIYFGAAVSTYFFLFDYRINGTHRVSN